MNTELIHRLKSFGWRFSAYMVSVGLVWLTDNLASLELGTLWTAIIGLLLGELSKYWNNHQKIQGRTFFGRRK